MPAVLRNNDLRDDERCFTDDRRSTVKDRRKLLKIKLKSLAAEARIIRQEERRTKDLVLRNEMTNHRRNEVRGEARHTHIAYGYVLGRTYAQIEPGAKRVVDWHKVSYMILQYGPPPPKGVSHRDHGKTVSIEALQAWSVGGATDPPAHVSDAPAAPAAAELPATSPSNEGVDLATVVQPGSARWTGILSRLSLWG
jgi:hypothetical protein